MKKKATGKLTKEERARDHLERLRWPRGVSCPSCSSANVHRMGGRTQAGMFQCNACRRKFSCRTGTIMGGSHISLANWVAAETLLRSAANGMSAARLMRELQLGSYRTARALRGRIIGALQESQLLAAPPGRLLVCLDADAVGNYSARMPGRPRPVEGMDEAMRRRTAKQNPIAIGDGVTRSAAPRPSRRTDALAKDLPFAPHAAKVQVSRVGQKSSVTRSINRAVDLLEYLTFGPLRLSELQRASALPETTVRRIVKVLIERKMIRVGLSDIKLRLNIAMPGMHSPSLVSTSARLIASAKDAMLLLSTRTKLQVDLHVFEQNRMVRVESTHQGPIPSGAPVDLDLNVFASASGLAFLSTLDHDHVLGLVRDCETIPRLGLSRYNVSQPALFRELAEIRGRGFAARRVSLMPPDTFQGIAVPVMHDSRCVGCIAIQWPAKLISISFIRRRYLSQLKATAKQVANNLAEHEGAKSSKAAEIRSTSRHARSRKKAA